MVVTAKDALFLTDFRYATQAPEEVATAAHVVIEATSLWSRLWEILPELGVASLAFESAHMSHADTQRLFDAAKGGGRWEWRPSVNLVEALREQKDAAEVAAIRAWAKENGYSVSERGRVPASVLEAYNAAN